MLTQTIYFKTPNAQNCVLAPFNAARIVDFKWKTSNEIGHFKTYLKKKNKQQKKYEIHSMFFVELWILLVNLPKKNSFSTSEPL